MGMKGKNVSSILQTFFVTHKHAQWIIGKRIQKNERVRWNQTGCGCHGSMEIMSNFLIRPAGGIYCHTQLGTCTGNKSCFYFAFVLFLLYFEYVAPSAGFCTRPRGQTEGFSSATESHRVPISREDVCNPLWTPRAERCLVIRERLKVTYSLETVINQW